MVVFSFTAVEVTVAATGGASDGGVVSRVRRSWDVLTTPIQSMASYVGSMVLETVSVPNHRHVWRRRWLNRSLDDRVVASKQAIGVSGFRSLDPGRSLGLSFRGLDTCIRIISYVHGRNNNISYP